MKKKWLFLLSAMAALLLAACSGPAEKAASSSGALPAAQPAQAPPAPGPAAPEAGQDPLQIAVSDSEHTIVYELNGSPAAQALYGQLPLTLPVEDFGSNEKIVYPPSGLETADTPMAEGGSGTLAYYAPWGDVVLFYGAYSPNASLYELGRAVSGAEQIEHLSGTLEITALA